ncbi:MAG: dTDP-4-dehydrorhamnose 3,5-epimerase [Proteobacteria bacterium HN_bin10]|nr:MAG: dTDP-4-dehydrorhamnose 3,5-epimerase [Proteobacteria bacterium HN_bin10]
MKVTEGDLKGLLIIEPRTFEDSRGCFFETFHQQRYAEIGIPGPFVQDNFSLSVRGTLRGLHFQEPHAQGKLVMVTEGEVFDVAVDIRRGSPTFGRWFGTPLSAKNRRQLYIPPGFAHGFCVVSDQAAFVYKCTDFYAPEHEHGILWNDPAIGIRWPVQQPILSPKDAAYKPLADMMACLPA